MPPIMEDRILLMRTGGTVDAQPYEDPWNPTPIVTTLKGDASPLWSTVQTLDGHEHVDGFSWIGSAEDRFVKDSQEFTPEDMDVLASIIKNDERRYFILTHGTDAMAENAAALQKALAGYDKVVAFVGAMVPLSMHGADKCTGVEALQYTIDNLRDQQAGVHIVARDAHTRRLEFHDPATVEKARAESKKDLVFTVQARSR